MFYTFIRKIEAMDNTTRKKKQLANKIAVTCCLFAVMISLIIGLFLGVIYYDVEVEEYSNRAFSFSRMVLDIIDTDTIEDYLKTLEPDEYYYEVQEYLDILKENSKVDYLYLGAISKDRESMTYIWAAHDATFPEGIALGVKDMLSSEAKEEGGMGENKEKFLVYTDPSRGLYGSASMPVYNSNGKLVAFISADINMNSIKSEFISGMLKLFAMTALIAALASWLLYHRTKKQIVNPLNAVKNAVGEMTAHIQDEENIEIDCHTGDEIEDLANAFSSMNADIKQYIKEISAMTEEKQRMASELDAAAKIQNAALEHDFPNTPNYEILACMFPAKEVGGDFYDFYAIDDSHVAVLVADVSGKGIPAALLMISAKTYMKNAALYGHPLEKVFALANDRLFARNEEGFFITALGGILDLKTGEFQFINAGHLPPFIRNSSGQFEKKPVKADLVLGCFGGTEYHVNSIMLNPGDRLFLYTDGVTEGMDPDKNEYGFERLLESLNKHASKEPHDFLVSLFDDGIKFVGTAPQSDDITMLCLDYKAKL